MVRMIERGSRVMDPQVAETFVPKVHSLFLVLTWSRRVTNEMIYYCVLMLIDNYVNNDTDS